MARDEHKSDLEIYRRLLTYVLPYWAAFVVSIVGFLIYSLSNVSFVWLVSYIVDSLQSGAVPIAAEAKEFLSGILGEDGDLNRTLIPVLLVSTQRLVVGLVSSLIEVICLTVTLSSKLIAHS